MSNVSKINGYLIKDATARSDLSNEITRSINKDNDLDSKINTETTNRTNSNNDLQSQITYEISNRTSADSNLQTQINSLANGSPLVASSTSEMIDTTKTYVNTTDGNWYYYDGTEWQIGGTYQATEDSETLTDLDIKLKSITSESDYNLFNPYTCKNNYGLSTADGSESTNSSYFISDYIDLSNASGYVLKVGCNYPIYKVCFYDTSKTFISTVTGGTTTYVTEIPQNAVYCKLQFSKTEVSYDNRYKITCYDKGYILNELPYYPINYNDIENNSLVVSNLSDSIANTIVSESIKLNINPFKSYDFSFGRINTASGEMNMDHQLILTPRSYYIPKNTTISTTSDYAIIIFKYAKNGTFITRYNDTASTSVKILDNGFYKIVMRKPVESLLSDNDKNNMISSLSFEYDNEEKLLYTGEKVDLKTNSLIYDNTNITTFGQDACQYNGKIFEFNSSGQFKVIDIATKTTYTGFELDQYSTIKPHCNCVCFSNEFYSQSDPYPLLYVNAYNTAGLPKGTCYVHRITENNNSYTTTLIQTITIGFTDNEIWTVSGDTRNYGNFLVDTDNGHLIVYTLRDNYTRFFIFDLPDTSESSITLTTTDIIEYFDCEFFNYIQGGHYTNGKVYSLDGIGTSENPIGYLHVFDLVEKELVTTIDLKSLMYEPEAIFEYQNELWVGQDKFISLKF